MATAAVDVDDDDMELLMKEYYCMPTMAEITTESLLTKSQYAKVVFHDLLASYPTDSDVWCRYSVTDGVTVREGDKVALFRVGWNAISEHLLAVPAPMPVLPEDNEFKILFKVDKLPKDTREFYQLCYVSSGGNVCGASVPFQFHRPDLGELREVDEQGWGVVRSHTSIHAEKLLQCAEKILALQEKTSNLEKERDETAKQLTQSDASLSAAQRDLLQLIAEKGVLTRKNEQLEADMKEIRHSLNTSNTTKEEMALAIEKQTEEIGYLTSANAEIKTKNAELAQEIEELKRNNEEYLLKQAEMVVMVDELAREKVQLDRDAQRQREWTTLQSKKMEGCIQTLNNDKAELSAQLEDCTRLREVDAGRLHAQLDGLQQMLDVSTQCKEMAAQALRAEHDKVELLEKKLQGLEIELTDQSRLHKDEVSALSTQLRRTQQQAEKLGQDLAQEKRDLSACRQEAAENAAAAAQLRRESGFDPLLDEYEDLRRRAHMLAEENALLDNLRRENVELQKQAHQAAQESAGVAALEEENSALRVENGTLSRQLQQLRTSAVLNKLRDVEVKQLESKLAEQEAAAATLKADQEAKIEALLLEHSMMVSRLQEIEVLQNSGVSDTSRSVGSLIQANEELMRANEGLTQTNEKLSLALKAAEKASDGSEDRQLQPSPACLDLSFTIKVMDLQNRKGDTELALSEAQMIEEEVWLQLLTAQRAVMRLDQAATEAENELNDSDREIAAAELESVKLAAAMKQLQEAILNEDSVNGIPDTDQTQQLRLEVLLQRWDTLSDRRQQLDSKQHDLRQDAAVRAAERCELVAAVAAADTHHKDAVRTKYELLEKLVALDNEMLAVTAGTPVQQEAVADVWNSPANEERVVAIHDLDAACGEEPPRDLTSLNLTSAEWEFISPKKNPSKELAVSNQGSQVDQGSQVGDESELSQRLDLAAAEYRKLFLEKARLEKRLAVLEKQLANAGAHA